MDKLNNSDDMQQTKDEFKVWLKNFHEQLSTRNQSLKSCLILKQQINKELKINIEKHSNNSLNTSCLTIDVIPNKIKMQLEAGVNHLKTKSEQLNKCNDAINSKVEEETKEMRYKFYDVITKDDVALKAFHEVEDAIKDLSLKTDCLKREQSENRENFVKKLKERECKFNELHQSILMMEPIEQEMRFSVQNCNKKLDEKLKSLKLKSVEEANDESNESKELLADISFMKSQFNKK